jgi:hypothetical protein
MVLFRIAELFLETGIWTIKKTVGVGYWLICGTPKTETNILLEKLCNENHRLHDDLVIITKRLECLENENNISDINDINDNN